MYNTCDNVSDMPMIQVRNVPPKLHQELKVRATRAGMTLSDFLLRELERVADEPPVEDVLRRVRARGRLALPEPPSEVVRRARDADRS